MIRRAPGPALFPYTTLFRSSPATGLCPGAVPDSPVTIVVPSFDAEQPATSTMPRTRRFTDRKSTRLNSSHGYTSYAVFCLKKKSDPALDHLPRGAAHPRDVYCRGRGAEGRTPGTARTALYDDPPSTGPCALSLHDALPIFARDGSLPRSRARLAGHDRGAFVRCRATSDEHDAEDEALHRSEEHTSELQSRLHLVCRLLLEKKKRSCPGSPSTRGGTPTRRVLSRKGC